jgi:hypothetical protein
VTELSIEERVAKELPRIVCILVDVDVLYASVEEAS